MFYTINREALIYDRLDGDIVIIHLESGNYYNLSGSGATIWLLLAKSVSFNELVLALAKRYKAETPAIQHDLKAFLVQLEGEKLIIQRSEPNPAAASLTGTGEEDTKEAYLPPVLDVFTDMQDFLLVDPIHEVDENGLPKYTPQNLDET